MKYDERACKFNMDTGCVELLLRDGRKISIDCTGVEDALDVTMAQRTEAGECIPTKPFEFVFIPDDPVVEASVLITFLPAEVKKFSLDVLENIYELNVEIW